MKYAVTIREINTSTVYVECENEDEAISIVESALNGENEKLHDEIIRNMDYSHTEDSYNWKIEQIKP